jgi:hypothetical protein
MKRLIVAVFAVVLLASCAKIQIIQDIENTEIFTGSGTKPNLAQVRAAIVQAVVKKTWRPKDIDDNNIEATLSKGQKKAVVTISYTTEKYSIKHKSSHLLLEKDGSIHRRYNSWVRGLQITINKNLSKI